MAADPGDGDDLAGLLRAQDRPRYFATLFAPAALRRDLVALYGFAAEIGRIPALVREPGIGEIRLQWWADEIEKLARHLPETSGHPALRELARTVSRHALPVAALATFVEAHRREFYADAPADPAALEAVLGETESALFQLACLTAGSTGPDTADAAGHAGVAYGLTRRIANFAGERSRGRSFLPATWLDEAGLSAGDVFAPRPAEQLVGVIARAVALARHHLDAASDHIAVLPKPYRPIFLPLAVVAPTLRRIGRLGGGHLSQGVSLSDLDMLVRIGLARLHLTPASGGRSS